VLKPANEIRFFVSLECQTGTVISLRGVRCSMRDLIC